MFEPGRMAKLTISRFDDKGAWVEEHSVKDFTDWKYKPRRDIRGISTRTFTTNMRTFINYLKTK